MTTPDKEVNPTTDRAAGPWTTDGRYIRASERGIVSDVIAIVDGRARMTNEANAQFIVTACNAYEPMREALDELANAARTYVNVTEREVIPEGDLLSTTAWHGLIECLHNAEKAHTALSTLPVNDRHHSGSDSYQADAGAPALSEKFNGTAEWLPIETAPKNGARVLIFRKSHVAIGQFNDDKYLKRPVPFWDGTDAAIWGKAWAKSNAPTHWMPLPSPPGAEVNFSNDAERDPVSLKSDTSSQPASVPEADRLEELLVAAYKRGFQWGVEHDGDPVAAAHVGKAARDYADYTMHAPASEAGKLSTDEVAS